MAEQRPGTSSKPQTPDAAGAYPGDDAPPSTPGTGEAVCPDCQGSGKIQGAPCKACGGTGRVNKGIAGG